GIAGFMVAGCATGLPSVQAPSAASAPDGLRYEVAVAADASQLVIEASLPPGMPPYLGMSTGAVAFVRDLHVGIDDQWTRIAPTDTFYWLPDCVERGCRLRYRFMLR